MALHRNFSETVDRRARSDPAFRAGMLAHAGEAILRGEGDAAKTMLHDYIQATIGYSALGRALAVHRGTLPKMLSPTGNPTLTSLCALFAVLCENEAVDLIVQADRIADEIQPD